MTSMLKQYKQGSNATSVCIENLELHKGEYGYHLSAAVRVEDEHSIRMVDIPKIHLPISTHQVYLRTEHNPYSHHGAAFVNLGFGEQKLLPAIIKGREVLFTETVLEEKHVEMTLDEIEKKLGHKVKIVNK